MHKTTLYRRWGTREDPWCWRPCSRERETDLGPRHRLIAARTCLSSRAPRPRTPPAPRSRRWPARSRGRIAPRRQAAAANRKFWAERLALDGVIVERAMERGEVAAGTDPEGWSRRSSARSTCGCCSRANRSTDPSWPGSSIWWSTASGARHAGLLGRGRGPRCRGLTALRRPVRTRRAGSTTDRAASGGSPPASPPTPPGARER